MEMEASASRPSGPVKTQTDNLSVPHQNGRGEDPMVFEIQGRIVMILEKEAFERDVKFSKFHPCENNAGVVERDGQREKEIPRLEPRELLEVLWSSGSAPDPPLSSLELPPEHEPSKDSKYYLDTVMFEVEDKPYVVFKHHFLSSTVFDSFGGPDREDDGQPMHLNGVLKVEFESLIKLLHPSARDPLGEDDWCAVLKLSTRWRMVELRTLAMVKLDVPSLSPAKRVALGRENGIDKWVRTGYVALALRDAELSVEDFSLLGTESALDLSQKIRKPYRHARQQATIYKTARDIPPRSTGGESTGEAVSRIFEKELLEQSTTLSIVDRIVLARMYGVSEWLHSEYVHLAERDQDITLEEAKQLGLGTVAGICHMRARLGNQPHHKSMHFDVGPKIDKIFGNQLAEARADGFRYKVLTASAEVVSASRLRKT